MSPDDGCASFEVTMVALYPLDHVHSHDVHAFITEVTKQFKHSRYKILSFVVNFLLSIQ